MHRLKYLLILSVLIISCKNGNDSFYSYYAEEDLYRMPVLAPYELTHLYGMEEGEGADLWELFFHYGGDKGTRWFNNTEDSSYKPKVPVKEINVTKGIIYGYHSRQAANYPDFWFVVIPKEKVEKVFVGNEAEWKDYLKGKGITDIHLYGVWELFKKYKETYTLPWYNPKKNILPE